MRMSRTMPQPFEAANDLAGLDLAEGFRRALSATWRNLWILILCTLVFVLLAAALVVWQDTTFSARASIIIDPRVNESMGDSAAPTLLFADALVVDSEVEVIRSEDILQRVADRLDLISRTRDRIIAAGEPVPSPDEVREMVMQDLGRRVDVEREGKTFVIRITATAGEAQSAADIANAIVDEYLAGQIENQMSRTQQAGDWLGAQLKELGRQVIDAESRAEQFLYENDIPDEDARNAVADQLAAAQQNLFARQSEVSAASAEIATIDSVTGANGGTPGSLSLQTQLIIALGGTPDLRASEIGQELSRLRQTREATIEIARAEETSLKQQIASLKTSLADINQKQVHLREMRREAHALESQYETMLTRFQQNQGEDLFFRSNAQVIERAIPPTKPSNTNPIVTLGAAIIGGALVGFALIFLREQLNDTIRSSRDVQEQLRLRYFGPLPRLRGRNLRQVAPQVAARAADLPRSVRRNLALMTSAATDPLSRGAETLRGVVLELKARGLRGRKIVAVVSVLPDEGKTFAASNLAFLLEQEGRRVLLVDADTRNSSLTEQLVPVSASAPEDPPYLHPLTERLSLVTLKDYVTDRVDVSDALSGLLASPLGEADFVIIDTAPLAYVSDGSALAQIVDGAVLVTAWGKTTVSTLQRVLAMSPRLSEKFLGVCLSQTSPRLMKNYEFIPYSDTYYGSRT